MEIWKKIDVDGPGLWSISNKGRVAGIAINGCVDPLVLDVGPHIKALQLHKPQKYYYTVSLHGRIYYVHRLVMKYFGPPQPTPKHEVDHEDRNPRNNNIENLRWLTHQQNNFNKKNQTVPKTSKYRGVCWNKKTNSWRSYIMVNGKNKYIGLFKDEKEAAIAWNAKAREWHGEYCYQNVID